MCFIREAHPQRIFQYRRESLKEIFLLNHEGIVSEPHDLFLFE